jgi:hypothetical protein
LRTTVFDSDGTRRLRQIVADEEHRQVPAIHESVAAFFGDGS